MKKTNWAINCTEKYWFNEKYTLPGERHAAIAYEDIKFGLVCKNLVGKMADTRHVGEIDAGQTQSITLGDRSKEIILQKQNCVALSVFQYA